MKGSYGEMLDHAKDLSNQTSKRVTYRRRSS